MKCRLIKMKRNSVVFLILSLLVAVRISAQVSGWELSGGLQSFYIPAPGFHVNSLQPVVQAGRTFGFSPSSTMGITMRIGYSRNRYQGDAVYVQSLVGYFPSFGQHLQGGVALGLGYQRSFYSGSSWQWDGQEWEKGRSSRTVWQVPIQFRLGYRTPGATGDWTPFIAYQVHGQFKYSPDLTPLPVSNFLIGVQYAPNKPE